MDLAPHLQGLLAALDAPARRALARRIAMDLRSRTQRRIAAQINPDGTPYAPRKSRQRDSSGRIRRGLFARLRTTRYLRAEGSAEAAILSIAQRAAHIARVHQYGLVDRVAPGGPQYRYPVRRILGFAPADEQAIADLVMDHFARAL